MEKLPWGEMPPIRIYNSMTRKEEDFPPVSEHPDVSIYVCGPTAYTLVHVGNMRGPVLFDVIRKVFAAHGYRVKFVTNFTDVDDKMIEAAVKAGEADPVQWSARYVHEYYTDLFALGVEPADVYPKVTTHIEEIIEYVKRIEASGHTYIGGDGSLYFDVHSYPDYLKLSGRKLEDLLESEEAQKRSRGKRDPRDFALWKIAKEGEPAWPSPWGAGRPGWHIECSVMSTHYLGGTFDIHGGGQELRFPHHENEIAQAACAGDGFARIWMHYEWVTMEGAKMAKSGRSLKIRDVLKEHHPEIVRLFLLSAHYRRPVDFTFEKLGELDRARDRIIEAFKRLADFLKWRAEERKENWLQIWRHWDERHGFDAEAFKKRMLEDAADVEMMEEGEAGSAALVDAVRTLLYRAHRHLADDFNTQGAAGELFHLVNRVNAHLDKMSAEKVEDFDAANIALGALVHLTELFGILREERGGLYATEEGREEAVRGGGDAAKLAEVLLSLREQARAARDFELADKIRDQLAEIGAEIRDTREGARIVWG